MTARQWRRVKVVFEEARQLSAPAIDEYLHRLCASDPEVAEELRTLLSSYRESELFLTTGSLGETVSADLADAGFTLVGRRLGAYQVGPLIGVGGMGEVYCGERADGEFVQRVAIKVIRGAGDPATISRFRAERQILAGLTHPNIARLYDGGTTEAGEPYFVMEHIEGQPVGDYCKTNSLDDGRRLCLFQAVCRAVHYAHEHGILHGDIKPANVMVGEDGAPRLVDFGVARLIGGGDDDGELRAWTPSYASPEQKRNEPLTRASDVYSLGVVLFELLTGARFGEAAGRRLPRGLAGIIAKATDFDPSQRYASAAALSAALDAAQERMRSLPRMAAVAGAVFMAVVLAVFVWRERGIAHENRSIAVIAIENLSQDPSLDWMDRGIAELLTTGLAQTDNLSVVSTERVRSLIGRHRAVNAKLGPAQARDVAVAVRADVFISGTLLRAGPRLRLDVSVQDTASGKLLFIHRVEGDDVRSVFRMADETVAQLRGHFGWLANKRERLTSNVEALRAYSEGLRLGQRMRRGQALVSLRRAVALDPGLAMAHYWIARYAPWDPKLCREESRQAMNIAEALALPRRQQLRIKMQVLKCAGQVHDAKEIARTLTTENPQDAELWLNLAELSFNDGEMVQSVAAIERSLSLDPGFPEALLHDAYLRAYLGDLNRALDSAGRYQATLEPGDHNGLDLFGDVHAMFGRLDDAIGFYRKENNPGKIGRAALHQGRYDVAESELHRQIERMPPGSPWRGFNYQFLGDVEVARGRLDRAGAYFEEAVRAHGGQLWFGADAVFKGAQIYLEQGDPRGALAFSGRLSNPWSAGVRATADLLLGKSAEAEVEFAMLKTSVSVVLGDVVADQADKLSRGIAAYYGRRPAQAVALLSDLPFSWRIQAALALGRAYLEQGDLLKAERELEFVLKSHSVWGLAGWEERQSMLTLLLANCYMGELCERQGRNQEAAAHYRKFYSHFENSPARLPQIAAARLALRRITASR